MRRLDAAERAGAMLGRRRPRDGGGDAVALECEAYANCRVHKNCGDAYCEFRRLPWELRALRERDDARGASARLPPRAWADLSKRELEAWNERAERERKRARVEEAKIAKALASAARLRDGGRARERVKGVAEAKREKTPEPETEETRAMRAARQVYDERMARVRRLTRRRATTLARAATVVVDPETCKVMGRLNAEELRVMLKLDSKKQAYVDEKRRANAKTPLKGPILGDMYRMPRLYEEVWLFEDSDTGVPTASELIHMMVRM